jgi:hypothetical protein
MQRDSSPLRLTGRVGNPWLRRRSRARDRTRQFLWSDPGRIGSPSGGDAAGQLPFFIDFLKTAGLFDAFVADCPLRCASPRSSRVLRGSLAGPAVDPRRRYNDQAALWASGRRGTGLQSQEARTTEPLLRDRVVVGMSAGRSKAFASSGPGPAAQRRPSSFSMGRGANSGQACRREGRFPGAEPHGPSSDCRDSGGA